MAIRYHPAALANFRARTLARRRPLGQPLVEIKPDVKVEAPIRIELGGLPLSIGLFGGSALAFLVRSGLPKGWLQTVSLVAGGALAAAGIVNLILPKAEAASAKPRVPAPVAPGGLTTVTREWTPPAEDAFDAIVGTIASPADQATVDLGAGATSYPVRVQFQNPTATPISFELILIADENPSVGSAVKTTFPAQVTVPPGNQVQEVDIPMPITAWNWYAGNVRIYLDLYKRRFPGAEPILIDSKEFKID